MSKTEIIFILTGIFIGLCVASAIRQYKELISDVHWCRAYVDNHLNQEQKESLK